MEREVREMLKSKSNRAPAMNEPPKPVLRRARTRKVTNSIGLAAIVAILAVGSVATVRSLSASRTVPPITSGSKAKPVPWIAISADLPGLERPCRTTDLVFSADAGSSPNLTFRPADANTRCIIDTQFELSLVDPSDGHLFNVRIDKPPLFHGIVVDGSSNSASMLFEWVNGCAPSTGSIQFQFNLPRGGGSMAATGRNGGEQHCSGSRSSAAMLFTAWGVEHKGHVGGQQDLRPAFEGLPASIPNGGVLTYTLALNNPTALPIPLDPCPVYEETMTIRGFNYSHSWRLNCAAAPRFVPARSSVRFAMSYTVPQGAGGRAVFDWVTPELGTPGTHATASITVT